MYTLPRCLITGGGGGGRDRLGAEIDVQPVTVPDYWGAEIDWGLRSLYTLSRCLITGGGGGRDRLGAEINVHPATVLITGGAEIDWGPRSMYTLSRCLITRLCLITGGPRSTGA